MKRYWVYSITNKNNSVFYTGITNSIERRIYEHKQSIGSKFAKRYCLNKLVYLEEYNSVIDAISREKQIKAGSRKKKIELIESINPDWMDLSATE